MDQEGFLAIGDLDIGLRNAGLEAQNRVAERKREGLVTGSILKGSIIDIRI